MACITRTITGYKEEWGTGNSYFTVFLDYDIIVYATESGEVVNAECILEDSPRTLVTLVM